MFKKVFAIAVIFIASGVWLHLDCLNRQELGGTEQVHQGVENARAEANKRVEAARAEAKRMVEIREGFENQILIDLNHCQVAAEKSNNDFINLIEQSKLNQNDQSHSIAVGLKKLQTAAYAECKRIYDGRIKAGT